MSLKVREFGKDARTASIRELAKRSKGQEEGPAQGRRLFDERLHMQMQKAGGDLTASQRLSTAMRRTENQLFREAIDSRHARSKLKPDFEEEEATGSTPVSAALVEEVDTMSEQTPQQPPTKSRLPKFHASPAVRVAEQMRIRREQMSAGTAQGQTIVVNSAASKLPVWKPGPESEVRGFNWKTKQKMVHAWETYQLSEGLHAPKTFKSMIDPELVPLICAECNLEEGDWEMLDDVTLLSAIEDRLKPHDAMDFTVQLRQIRFEADDSKGTLTQRYRLFAEPFLAKISEARAASCELPENVIKLTFARAVSSNPILQGWLEQQKWTTAAEVHRRITSQLKMVEAYNTLTSIASTQRPAPSSLTPSTPPVHQQQVSNRGARFNAQIQVAVNNAMAAYQRQVNGGTARATPMAGSVNVMQHQQREPLPPFPGMDGRGVNWHVHSAMLGCKQFPCTAPFCQACGLHHHTANECRKRVFKNPGINTAGYWSEQKPNTPPLRYPKPAGTVNAAVQASSFPTPYRMKSPAQVGQQLQDGGTINHAAQQPPAPQSDITSSAQ
jgi:hypothetical protein